MKLKKKNWKAFVLSDKAVKAHNKFVHDKFVPALKSCLETSELGWVGSGLVKCFILKKI